MTWLKKGKGFLPKLSKKNLKNLYTKEKNPKAKLRLLAAVLRKEGKTLDEICFSLQKAKTTIHDWLRRLEDYGLKKLYDVKQSGKPPRLSKQQLNELAKILDESPQKENIPFVLWTTKLVQYIILKKFKKEFKIRQIRNIIKKINFTLQVPRQKHKKANKKAQERFKKDLKKKFNITLNLDSRPFVLMKHTSQ